MTRATFKVGTIAPQSPAGALELVKLGRWILSDGIAPEKVSANDPLNGGLLVFGWHHLRDIPGETNIWNKGWDMHSRRRAVQPDPFGVSAVRHDPADPGYVAVDFVDRYSAADGKRILCVEYRYKLDAVGARLSCVTVVTEMPDGIHPGPDAYIKEPKFTFGVNPERPFGARYDAVEILDAKGKLLRTFDLSKIRNPKDGTFQVRADTRSAARFTSKGAPPLTIRAPWTNGGLDRWAVDANTRDTLHLATDDPLYCRQGPNRSLSRNWEIAKYPSRQPVTLMMHAWEGGSGLPDCLSCAVRFEPGRRWKNEFEITIG